MADEGFLSRWSRRKAASREQQAIPPVEAPVVTNMQPTPPVPAEREPAPEAQPGAPQAEPRLTMEDVAKLTRDSDYSAFLARGVDESVKRSALKKLFADPHFNVMDGLDVYIDDYNKFEPIGPAMLAALNHAKPLLDPLSRLERPVMPLADDLVPEEKRAEEIDEPTGDTETPEGADAADTESATAQHDHAAQETTVDSPELPQERP